MTTHAFAQREHASAVTGRVEGQAHGEQAPRERVAQECDPRSAQVSPGAGADQLHVKLRVIKMAELEWSISMAGGGQAQLPIKWRGLDASPRSLAFGNLFLAWTTVGCFCERLVSWSHEATLFTGPHQRYVHGELSLLFERLVVGGNDVIHKAHCRFRQLSLAVAALAPLRQEPNVAAAIDLIRGVPARQPPADRSVWYRAGLGSHTRQDCGDDCVPTVRFAQVGWAGSGQLLVCFGANAGNGGRLRPDERASASNVGVPKETHPLGLGQRRRAQINVQPSGGDQRVDVVNARLTHLHDQVVQLDARLLLNHCQDDLRPVPSSRQSVNPQVVLQEAQVALEDPVDLGRRAQSIEQAERLGKSLPRRAPPTTDLIAAVAMRHHLRQALQLDLGLPLLPSDSVAADDEVVGCVPDADVPSTPGLVNELDRRGLVVELQGLLVMLVLVDSRELDAVAFCLDDGPHLPTRIAHRYIPRRAPHAARRR